MQLSCPNCDAKYQVPDDAVPEAGRDVQCSNCGHAWFQLRPEVEIAAEEEAALFGDDMAAAASDASMADVPPPVPTPPVPTPPVSTPPVPTPPVSPPPAPEAAPRRDLDDSVLAVLREEAEREAEARRAEARRADSRRADAEGQMQVQPDLGVGSPAPAAAASLSPVKRRLAMLKGEDPDAAPAAPARPTARRDLLPDVEEINSTLQPGDAGSDDDSDAAVDALPDLTKSWFGFRTGFLLMFFLLVLAALVYVTAPRISAMVPALEQPLASYVAFVDGLRLWLNQAMDRMTKLLTPSAA